jgi:hypothetical protein
LTSLLLQSAPDPIAIFPLIVKRLYPSSGWGSWATEMEGCFKLLEKLDVGDDVALRQAKSDSLALLRTQIDNARRTEARSDVTRLHRQRQLRFRVVGMLQRRQRDAQKPDRLTNRHLVLQQSDR